MVPTYGSGVPIKVYLEERTIDEGSTLLLRVRSLPRPMNVQPAVAFMSTNLTASGPPI